MPPQIPRSDFKEWRDTSLLAGIAFLMLKTWRSMERLGFCAGSPIKGSRGQLRSLAAAKGAAAILICGHAAPEVSSE